MYMPPEQVRDAGEVREPADMYSVGVTLYYVLTGQYSFDFPTPKDIADLRAQRPDAVKRPQDALRMIMQLRRIRHPFVIILGEEPIAVRQREPSIPARLAAVVDRAVRKSPAERFQSAAEFRLALRRAV
jgi:serine/threonine protein kinase